MSEPRVEPAEWNVNSCTCGSRKGEAGYYGLFDTPMFKCRSCGRFAHGRTLEHALERWNAGESSSVEWSDGVS